MAGIQNPVNRAIGLLGGAFNPAHEGHIYLSQEAIRRLGLEAVWWLVAADHPVKPQKDLAPFAERVAQAETLAKTHAGIDVSTLEQALGTRYTYDTLAALRKRFPDTRFVWLMGADNLADFSGWHRWREIFETIPIATFARKPYTEAALYSEAATTYKRFRITGRDVSRLAFREPPAWCFIRIKPHPLSSTEIRKKIW